MHKIASSKRSNRRMKRISTTVGLHQSSCHFYNRWRTSKARCATDGAGARCDYGRSRSGCLIRHLEARFSGRHEWQSFAVLSHLPACSRFATRVALGAFDLWDRLDAFSGFTEPTSKYRRHVRHRRGLHSERRKHRLDALNLSLRPEQQAFRHESVFGCQPLTGRVGPSPALLLFSQSQCISNGQYYVPNGPRCGCAKLIRCESRKTSYQGSQPIRFSQQFSG